MAAKKKTDEPVEKRPARQFYTKAGAERDRTAGEKVAGSYVLAERTGNS